MLQTHLHQLPTSFAILTSSLNTLRLESNLRIRVADALVPPTSMKSKLKDILYAMVVVDERVVTIARPRKHTVHPTDIHILLATIGSPAVKGNTASWLPICLPKFNPNGLLHAYASYLDLPSSSTSNTPSHPVSAEQEEAPQGTEAPLENGEEQGVAHSPSICLVIVSASGDFETVRQWADVATQRLNEAETLKHLVKAARKSAYSVDELGIPGLRHFYYKSRANVQVTAPVFEGFDPSGKKGEIDIASRVEEWERLFGLYRLVWDAIHAKSGQECTLKLQYVRTEKVCVMGWVSGFCHMYN
jgi:vacuolar fusion protein MON1